MDRNILADIHNHSTASDGELTPAQIVLWAKNLGLKGFGLTDHDTLQGLNEAITSGDGLGITVLPGVEVSLKFQRPFFTGTLHLLLYFSPQLLKNTDFTAHVEATLKKGRGESLIRSRVSAINREFGPHGAVPVLKNELTFEEISARASNISRRHFSIVLKENHGITDGATVQRILANESPAYVPSGVEMEGIRPLLESYPVVPVLAHPAAGEFPGPSHYREVLPPLTVIETLYPEFLHLGIEGIEVHYPGHLPEHRALLRQWAEKDHLIITGGSDCHDRIGRPLGVDGMTPLEWEIIQDRINEKSLRMDFN